MKDTIQFHCIQPIKINEVHYRKFLQEDYNDRRFERDWTKIYYGNNVEIKEQLRTQLTTRNTSEFWKNLLTIQTDSYFNLYLFSQDATFYNDLLVNELCLSANDLRIVDLQNFVLNKKESGFSLSYDKDSRIFTIMMTISLAFDFEDDSIAALGSIFRWARNKMVYDDIRGNTVTTNWAKRIKENCLEKLSHYLRIDSTALEIPPSTGYIVASGLNDLSKVTSKKFKAIKNRLLLNNKKEDVKSNGFPEIPDLTNQENNVVYLGWSYSTIIGLNKKDSAMILLSLLLHQNTFVQLRHFYAPYVDRLSESLRYSSRFSDVNLYHDYYNAINFALRSMKQGHNRLLIRQQKWQSDLHSWVWRHWKTDFIYKEIEDSLSAIEKVIDKKLQTKNNVIQSTQSSILFILTLIQLFGIASIITGYFDLFKLDIPASFGDKTKNSIEYVSDNLGVLICILSTLFIILVYRVNIGGIILKLFRLNVKKDL